MKTSEMKLLFVLFVGLLLSANCLSQIIVTSAIYAGNCGAPTNVPSVAISCNGLDSCIYYFSYGVDPGYDPAFGCPKDFYVNWKCCPGGPIYTAYKAGVDYTNGMVTLTCPAPSSPITAISSQINVSCKGENNGSAIVFASGGIRPYIYSWSPSGGTDSAATGLLAGTYTVTITDVSICNTATQIVTITEPLPLLLAVSAVNNESCLNSLNGSATVNASGGTAPYLYSWNTSPIQYAQTVIGQPAGTYIATVADTNNCIDTTNVIINRNPDPTASFSNTTVCNGSATQFTDNSTTASGSISTWLWDFGDTSAFNTTQNPSHLYANAGTYTVTLIVNNSFGCSDTVIKPVQVYYKPFAGFSSNNVCFGDTMHFSNSSSVDTSTSIATYLWLFGDSSPTSSLQTPAHYYSAAGTYTVTLVTTTIDGCSNAATISVKAYDAPTNAFTFSNTCLFDSAQFTNTSLPPLMGSIASCSWNVGDGSPSITQAPPLAGLGFLYATPGNYQVTLITYSSNLACSDTLQDTITVFQMPIANFSFTNVCLTQATNCNDSSTVSNGNITSRLWNFGDGTPSDTLQNPSHIYANPGTYSVVLIATTNNGCKDTITKNVVVHPLPVAAFNTSNVCDGNSVSFIDSSGIITSDTLQSRTWNFGDGSAFSTNQNPSHLYAAVGSYTVQLLVVSNFGCSNDTTKTVIVNPNPTVKFTGYDTTGCEPLCVIFQDSSSIVTGTNASRLWNFGDGSQTSSLQNSNHCYTNDSIFSAKSFNVTLTVTSDSGCVSIVSKNNYITVYPNPNADFTVEPKTTTIIEPVISITDLSTGTNYRNWNFGDGNPTSINNPSPHSYADTGAYIITLITSTQYNCLDTAYQTIIIEPDFLFYIPNAFTPNDDGINDSFSAKGIFIKEFEMRIFDRWGNLIFFSDDINKPWDGKVQLISGSGEVAQADVYVYSIKLADFKRWKHNYKGIVTLVR